MGKKAHFWLKWPKKAILAGKPPFWGFLALFGPFGPGRARGFTSTPRGRGGSLSGGPGGLSGPVRRDPGDQGPGVPGIPGSGNPSPRGRGSPGEASEALRPRDRGPDPSARGVLHQPLAAGPRGTRRGSPGPGSPGGLPEAENHPRPGGGKIPLFWTPGEPRCDDGGHPPVRGAPGGASKAAA